MNDKELLTTQSEQPDHPSLAQKALTKVVYVALAVIAACIGLVLYWSFQDEKVIDANNEPFPVRTIRNNAAVAGVVILKVDFCKYYDIDGDQRISFLSSNHEVFMPITRERSPKGCSLTEIPIIIPATVAPGEYSVKFYVTYDLNPLKQNIRNEFESKRFQIVE